MEYERTMIATSKFNACIMTREAAKAIVESFNCDVDDLAEPCVICGTKSWSCIKKIKNKKVFNCCPSCIDDVIKGVEEL